MGISFRQLEYFVTVAEAGSITRAAELLRVTPTAISLQIRALEDLVGAPLFSRHSRGIIPTAEGEGLFTEAKHILAMIDKLERSFTHRDRQARQICLGTPPAFSRLIGLEAIEGATAQLGINLSVVEGWTQELEQRLERRKLDCLIGWEIPRSPELHVTPLIEDEFVFVCAPEMANGGDRIALREALRSPLLFYGRNSVSWRVSQEAALFAGIELPQDRHVESITVWRSMLCRGLGTSIVSMGAIKDEYLRGEVVVQKIADYAATRMIEVAVRIEHRSEPWAIAIAGFLKSLVADAQSRFPAPQVRVEQLT